LIEFKKVDFWYGEENGPEAKNEEVLREVDLEIPQGKFMVLLGRNGSGKSTLAKHTNGLLLPKSGEVIVDGMNTRDEGSIWEIRRRVGLVFQNPDNQIIATTVEEDVAFGPENLGLPREEIIARVEEALNLVGMAEYRDKEPHLLSGGQKQRVAIAGVLAMHPEYLILDEATSMLDPEGRGELMKVITNLREKIAIFHITHNVEEATEADEVLVMDEGRIVAQGKPREVFSQVEKIEKWGLELPQVTETALLIKKQFPSLFGVLPLSPQELVGELCS